MTSKEQHVLEEWDEETRKDWQEKMSEPLGFEVLSPEQIEELRKQGYNV